MRASVRWGSLRAPSPCSRTVKRRCGPRENSSRTELLDGLVACHGRTLRSAEHLVAQEAPMEELQQLLVVGAVVGEDELLQRGVALLPRRRSAGQELAEIVEVGVGARVADLVEALQVTREPERDPELVAFVLVGE